MDDSPKEKAASAGVKPDLRLGFRARNVKVKFGMRREVLCWAADEVATGVVGRGGAILGCVVSKRREAGLMHSRFDPAFGFVRRFGTALLYSVRFTFCAEEPG
jgi:hypothetical protein